MGRHILFKMEKDRRLLTRYDVQRSGSIKVSDWVFYMGLDGKTIATWLYMALEASKKGWQQVVFDMQTSARAIGISEKDLRKSVKTLADSGIIEVSQVSKIKEDVHTRIRTYTPVDGRDVLNESNDLHWLAKLWNDHCGDLPKVQIKLSNARLKKINSLVRQYPDKEKWKEGIMRIASSDFCRGLNDRSWVASFDFLLRAETLEKIFEGKYDNRPILSKNSAKTLTQMERIKRGEF